MNSANRIYLLTAISVNFIGILNGQWIQQNSGSTTVLNDVVMLNSTTAIAVGRDGSILKTTNSGKTWRNTAPRINGVPDSINCVMGWNAISFGDALQGIVVGESLTLLTMNSGETWTIGSLKGPQRFLSAC